MRIIKPSFEILSAISPEGINELKLLEKAARTCYQSGDKITEDGESAKKIISNTILKYGHESVLEHGSITVAVTCDRGITHEIVRHRIASYSQESTRYCNYANDKFGNEITYVDISKGMEFDPKYENLDADAVGAIYSEWMQANIDAEKHYINMLELGASPQIARSVLNNSTKTTIVITMNHRSWRHFFKLRTSKKAHPQMREIAIPMLTEFKRIFPTLYGDIEVKE